MCGAPCLRRLQDHGRGNVWYTESASGTVCVHTARPCAREQRKQQEVAFQCADEIEGAGIARKCELLIKISYLCCFPLLSARKERVDCFFPAPELSGSVVINMLNQGSAPCCSEVFDNSFGGDRYFLEPCARSTRRCSRILSTARGSFPSCIANLVPGVGRMHQKAAADRIPGPRGPESGVLQPVSVRSRAEVRSQVVLQPISLQSLCGHLGSS